MTDFDPTQKFAARFAYKMRQLADSIESHELELERIRSVQQTFNAQLECPHTWTSEKKLGGIVMHHCSTCDAVVVEETGSIIFQ